LYPKIIKGSQKRRISIGSGIKIQEINQLLKKFNEVQRIIQKIKTSNISKIIQGITNMIPRN